MRRGVAPTPVCVAPTQGPATQARTRPLEPRAGTQDTGRARPAGGQGSAASPPLPPAPPHTLCPPGTSHCGRYLQRSLCRCSWLNLGHTGSGGVPRAVTGVLTRRGTETQRQRVGVHGRTEAEVGRCSRVPRVARFLQTLEARGAGPGSLRSRGQRCRETQSRPFPSCGHHVTSRPEPNRAAVWSMFQLHFVCFRT